MNPTVTRVSALAAFLCVIAIAVWVLVYYGYPIVHPSTDDVFVTEVAATPSTTLDWASLATTTIGESSIEVDVGLNTFFGNPFSFAATNTFPEDLDWKLVDASKIVLASGTIPGFLSSYNASFDRYWYEAIPSSQFGVLIIQRPNKEAPLEFPVQLETKTQTIEVYFRDPAMSNCSTVEPVKRTIVSTGEDGIDYYEAALHELLKGPSTNEYLVTMIPSSTRLMRLGQHENGRYVADFDSLLEDDIAIDCFRLIAEKQIEETLATIRYPGKRLTGILMINGEEVDWGL